jgi:hypothetical protein
MDNAAKRLAVTSQPAVGNRARVRKPAAESRCIELFTLLRLLMVEYRDEQAARYGGMLVWMRYECGCTVSGYCDNSMREKVWRRHKRGMQAT